MEEPWPEEADAALTGIADQRVRELRLEANGLGRWDTSLLVFLVQMVKAARARKLDVDLALPEDWNACCTWPSPFPRRRRGPPKKATRRFCAGLGTRP